MVLKKIKVSIILVCLFVVVGGCLVSAQGLGKKVISNKKSDEGDRLPPKHPMAPEYFAICSATLDGKNFTEIVKDTRRQMSHIRVSPDGQWITFTRFNKIDPKKGIAIEEDGYQETEILICRVDGSNVRTLVPPKKGKGNCNSYWTPDGKGVIHISTDNPQNKGQIYITDVATGDRKRVPTPEGLEAGDPFTNGKQVVFPGRKPGLGGHVIYIMDIDGSNARPLSSIPQIKSKGEYDPKISPDGSKVAFMRLGREGRKGDVHVIVVDVKTGKEKDLSIPGNINLDCMPEWSSDGKLLVFWHANRANLLDSGLYTIRPDGTDRKKVPLAFGYQYTIPSFFPGSGSGEDAKIIFSAREFPAPARRKHESLQKK